jgi:glucose-6-phosphate dehydrogenase assembly protein OpcA
MTGHAASIHDVEAILAELRRAVDNAAAGSDATPSIATLNLVAYVDDATHHDWVLERAARLIEKHPARFIVLDAAANDGGADVATEVRGNDGATVVSQRVDLAIGDAPAAIVHSLVHDLCVANTPTVLWWASARMDAATPLAAIADDVNALVVDSSGPGRGDHAVNDAVAFALAHPSVILRDLAYMRLAPWQDMIAQFFDDPALFEDLFSITGLEVDAGSDAEALYLAAWLASRLSWRVRDGATFLDRANRAVSFVVARRGDPRRVQRVRLHSEGSTYTAAVSDDEAVVCLSIDGENAREKWCVPLQSVDIMSLVERATTSFGRDQIFDTTLPTVAGLRGKAVQ